MNKSLWSLATVFCLFPQFSQAEGFLNLFEINCLPEIGVLQIAPRPYPAGNDVKENFYQHDVEMKTALEDKNFYFLKENAASSVQKNCQLRDYNVQADLQSVACKGQENGGKCFDTNFTLKVGDKVIVDKLDLSQFSDERTFVNIEFKVLDAVRYLLQLDYVTKPKGLASVDSYPKGARSMLLSRYRLTYDYQDFEDGFVLKPETLDFPKETE